MTLWGMTPCGVDSVIRTGDSQSPLVAAPVVPVDDGGGTVDAVRGAGLGSRPVIHNSQPLLLFPSEFNSERDKEALSEVPL